ncbi:MAG: hypothetical protein ACPG5W_06495 [Flavobacteriales bacterium]
MRRTLLNPVFLICVCLTSANQIIEKGFGVFIPIVHAYLDDLLCFPIVLTLGLAVYRLRDKHYTLSLWHILPVLVVYSVYFEWYLPRISETATSDPIDVVMYLLGLTVFGYFINRNDAVGLT